MKNFIKILLGIFVFTWLYLCSLTCEPTLSRACAWFVRATRESPPTEMQRVEPRGDVQRAGSIVVPYIPLPAAKDPNTGIELSAQQNDFQFRCWILPAGTKIIYPDGTEKKLFEKGFLTMAKKRGD